MDSRTPHDGANWLTSFALVQAWIGRPDVWNTPAWSLSAEWLAYLFFPIAAWWQGLIKDHRIAAAAAISSLCFLPLFAELRHYPTFDDNHNFGLMRCACEFFAGMAAFRFVSLCPDAKRFGRSLLVAGSTLLAVSMIGKSLDAFAAFGFLAVIVSCWCDGTVVNVVFGNRVIAWLGKVSFSPYIIHWLLLETAIALAGGASADLTSSTAAVTLALVAAIPTAALLYACVEMPSHDLGKRSLRGGRVGRSASAVVTSNAS